MAHETSHRNRGIPAVAAALWLAGCVTTPLPGVPVQDVDAAAVQGCTSLGAIEVTTVRDTGSPSADLQRVKDKLLADARERGATHLVLAERDLRFALALARGTAYRCGQAPAPAKADAAR